MNRATSPTGWARNPDGSPGYTWNPLSGCRNHTPEGLCLGGLFPCYAYKLANGRLKPLYLANLNLVPTQFGDRVTNTAEEFHDPFYPRGWFSRRERELEGGKPKGVFVCDMGDLFGIGIPESWTNCVLETIKVCPEHRFYILTKQAQRLPEFSPFPDNTWVGVTATNTKAYIEANEQLAKVEARVKYLSLEPLLEKIDCFRLPPLLHSKVSWIIIGACTGTHIEMLNLFGRLGDAKAVRLMPLGGKYTLQPKIEWVREIVEAADKAGVKVFLKDNLRPLLENEPLDPLYWANVSNDERGNERADDELRQELPTLLN